METKLADVEQAKDKKHLFEGYGTILGTRISPASILAMRYFEKNYGKIIKLIPEDSKVLEIGPGGANFTQYLLYKGYENITVCERSDDNARSLSNFFGDRIKVIKKDAIGYLGGSSDRFDLIFSAQLIEHFSYDDFVVFLEHCYASLNRGGYIVFETINCANVIHGLYLRYCDYTHRMGFTPRSLKHFLMAVGNFSDFRVIEIRPPGLLECVHYIHQRIKRDPVIPEVSVGSTDGSHGSPGGLNRLVAISLKSLSIRLSRWLSFFLLRPYEFESINVYTPFFAIIARKG